MSYIIRGHKDLLFDPIGSVSTCCKVHTKLNMTLRTTVCSQCGKACDMFVPETKEEFEQPEIKGNGQSMWQYDKNGLEWALE
jgi:hypothetical protein